MKIIGKEENINEIVLMHRGKQFRYGCIVKPLPYEERSVCNKPKRAEITFDDLQEVNSLISILERFRDECTEYIGEWR